jgi:hypothetical protein
MLRTLFLYYASRRSLMLRLLPLRAECAPSYQADPGVHKVIFEDHNFRVIRATRKAGQVDQPHSHPGSFGGLSLNNCSLLSTSADGTTHKVSNKAGTAG